MNMLTEASDNIDVKFFGEFEFSVNGRPVALKFGKATKATQVLALLMYNYPSGLSSDGLIHKLFRDDDVLNPKGNLKVYISQLRKELTGLGLSGTDCIVYKEGKYFWGDKYPLSIDAKKLEKLITEAESDKTIAVKKKKYSEALSLYTGDFMREMAGIDWVEEMAEFYRQLTFDAADKYSQIFMDEEDYEAALEVVNHISSNNLSEHWQIRKIECLMKLGKYKQAAKIYEDTVTTLANEFDVRPSEELLNTYREISKNVENAFTPFSEITKAIEEKKEEEGAYFCAFPGFIDSCRVIARNMMRNGQSCFLMMMCLADRFGNVLTNNETLGTASEALRNAIQQALRLGDSFSRYNTGQFLIFLPGTNRESCEVVAKRIEERFMSNHIRGVHLVRQEVSGAFHLE